MSAHEIEAPRKQPVSSPNAPAAIGPYSQAVVIDGFIYTSGQVALNPATGQMVSDGIGPAGIRVQTEQVLRNLQAVLAAAGCTLAHVIKTTVYLKDMSEFGAMNEVYAEFLAPEGVTPPARSTVEVARLPRDARVEIEVIARR